MTIMSARPLWTVLLFLVAAGVLASAASADRHLSTFTDTSSVSTPETEVTTPYSNVICKTLGQAGVARTNAVDLAVLFDTVQARPMPSPSKAPNPIEDLQIPNDTPGYVLGRASAGNPAPFSVNDLFQKSSQPRQSEPQPSGVKELAYDKLGFPYTTQSAHARDSPSPTDEYPWVASGQIFVTLNNERFSCSAALIAPGVLVTSAHCIAEYGTDAAASGLLQFIPGRFDSYAPYGAWSVQRICYPTVFAKGTDECRPDANGVLCANDLAVLILNPDSDGNYVGNLTGWMGYAWGGYSFSSSFKAGTLTAEVTQLGYPCHLDSCTRMIRTDAPAITQDYNQQVLGSAQGVGSNGGPWIVNFGADYVSKLSDPGIDSKPNMIVGVTTWTYNNQSLKVQGSSRFGTNKVFPNEPNIVSLFNAACSTLSSNERALACGPSSSVTPSPPHSTSASTPPSTPSGSCPASGGWKLDTGDMVCANVRAGCQRADTVYQELYEYQGQQTYCCRCAAAAHARISSGRCPEGWTKGDSTIPNDPCYNLAVGPCKQTGQFTTFFQPDECCICSPAGTDPPYADIARPPSRSPTPHPIVKDCDGVPEGTLCNCLTPGNNCGIDSETLNCYASNGGSIYGPVGICLSGVCNYCATRDPTPPFACPSGYRCRGQSGYFGDCTDQSFVYGTCVPV